MAEGELQRVVVTDIRMNFISMVIFMVKAAIAAIPALMILTFLGVLAGAAFQAYTRSAAQREAETTAAPIGSYDPALAGRTTYDPATMSKRDDLAANALVKAREKLASGKRAEAAAVAREALMNFRPDAAQSAELNDILQKAIAAQ